MNLTALRTFLAIVETGSLVRASDRLNVTQSTVTARLKSLEQELGQVLINRQKSGASLTAAGVRLRRYAETISELWRQARQEAALPDGMNAVCNLACHPDLWPHLGQRLFEIIRMSQPSVAISVWHGGQTDLNGWLVSGLADVALTYWPNAHQLQTVYPLKTDRLRRVSTRADSPVKFDPDYIYVEAGDEFGRQHAASYADTDAARLSFGSAMLGLEHMLKQGGSAYLPERIAAPDIQAGRLFHIPSAPEFHRNSFVVVNKTATGGWPWFEPALRALQTPDERTP